jgi:cell division protease FtsH
MMLKRHARLTRGLVLLVALGALAALIVVRGTPAEPPAKTVPITALLDLAQQKQLKTAAIHADHRVTAVAVDGTRYVATMELGDRLTTALHQEGVIVTVDPVAAPGLPELLYSVLTLLLVVGVGFYLIKRMSPSSQVGSLARTKQAIDSQTVKTTFADLAGVEEAKTELQEFVMFLKHPQRFKALGARVPRGVLLVGAPGMGKTLMARAVAGEAGVPFFRMNGSEFVEMFVGVGAARVRSLFVQAKKAAPCIVFIDEVDSIGGRRGGNHAHGGNDEREQTLNQLLTEMDGFDQDTHVVVLAATNRPDMLDSALLRPGRFDRRVTMDPPDMRGRTGILEVHAKGMPLDADVDLRAVARQTAGMSGAELANVVNEAAILAARTDRQTILAKDFEEAILRVLAGPEMRSRVLSAHDRDVVAYHEVGHALVMKSLPDADPVRKVQAIARGGALGMTVSSPSEDQYLLSESALKARIAGAMGGRVAEELAFGEITTGAQQDIVAANAVARRMVVDFGMSRLGMLAIAEGAPLSPELAARIDAEQRRLVEEGYQTARTSLEKQRTRLGAIALHLKEVETIEGEELDRLIAAEDLAAEDLAA